MLVSTTEACTYSKSQRSRVLVRVLFGLHYTRHIESKSESSIKVCESLKHDAKSAFRRSAFSALE